MRGSAREMRGSVEWSKTQGGFYHAQIGFKHLEVEKDPAGRAHWCWVTYDEQDWPLLIETRGYATTLKAAKAAAERSIPA